MADEGKAEENGQQEITPQMKRDFLALAMVLARMPDNLFNRPFKGQLAVMEVIRIVQAVGAMDGSLAWTDGETVTPLPELQAAGDRLKIGKVEIPLLEVVFHRSTLAGFAHLVLTLQEPDRVRRVVVCAREAPLLQAEGLRLIKAQFSALAAGRGELRDLHRQLEAGAEMLLQGNPFASDA